MLLLDLVCSQFKGLFVHSTLGECVETIIKVRDCFPNLVAYLPSQLRAQLLAARILPRVQSLRTGIPSSHNSQSHCGTLGHLLLLIQITTTTSPIYSMINFEFMR